MNEHVVSEGTRSGVARAFVRLHWTGYCAAGERVSQPTSASPLSSTTMYQQLYPLLGSQH